MHDALLISLGTSPKVLSCAIWRHANPRAGQPIYFSRIRVLTTQAGRAAFAATFGRKKNPLDRLLAAQRRRGFGADFDPRQDVTMLRGDDGAELLDLDTAAPGVIQQICDQIQALHREGFRVHATYAGGRKLMAPYFTTAFQLTARPDDRLFHVVLHQLLHEPVARRLFYPTRPIRIGKVVVPIEDQVRCVETPILRWPGAGRDDSQKVEALTLLDDAEFEWWGLYRPYPLRVGTWNQRNRGGDLAIGGPGKPAARKVALPDVCFFWYSLFARLAGAAAGTPISPDGPGLQLDSFRKVVALDGAVATAARARYRDVWELLASLYQACYPNPNQTLEAHLRQWLAPGATDSAPLLTTFSEITTKLAARIPPALLPQYRILSEWQFLRNQPRAPRRRGPASDKPLLYRIWLPPQLISCDPLVRHAGA